MTQPHESVGEWQVLFAPAKVNLFLEVRGRRADGYHDLVSIFHEIDFGDTVRLRLWRDGKTLLHCRQGGVPLGGENLVLRAVDALREATGSPLGVEIELEKRIPLGGGLGGGSSDAAATLRGVNSLWGLGKSLAELADIGATVGSDVPFFLYGGACRCEGRGERVTPLCLQGPAELWLILPPWSISTARVFQTLTAAETGERSSEAFLRAWASSDGVAIGREAFNRLEAAAFRVEPRQRDLHHALRASGAEAVCMSGSGSVVWALARGAERIEALREGVARLGDVRMLGVRLIDETAGKESSWRLQRYASD